MSVTVIVGAQWGDEGKGKIVDILSEQADIVARYQGGANAGHTVIINDTKYILHLIPSGILHQNVLCLIGNGVVLDPLAFFEELDTLKKYNIEYKNRIFIFPNTHIILPYHKYIDTLSEAKDNKIGTTGRGIGPCYVDKYSRIGIQAIDFLYVNSLIEKIKHNLKIKNNLIRHYYSANEIDETNLIDEVLSYREKLLNFILTDTSILTKAIKENKNVILEGAQGVLLDVDHGTYPFVTSSNPISGGATTGLGISPRYINKIIGVFKAYTTRVGEGPFPTELNDESGEKIRKIGSEFGATTGRPRRCGWLDLIALKYANQINGFDSLAITKVDVLTDFDEIKACVGYEIDGKIIDYFPLDLEALKKVKPLYKSFKSWKSINLKSNNISDLPDELIEYIKFIEDFTGTKISIISTGSERKQTIFI